MSAPYRREVQIPDVTGVPYWFTIGHSRIQSDARAWAEAAASHGCRVNGYDMRPVVAARVVDARRTADGPVLHHAAAVGAQRDAAEAHNAGLAPAALSPLSPRDDQADAMDYARRGF